jgi:hypothetical protein
MRSFVLLTEEIRARAVEYLLSLPLGVLVIIKEKAGRTLAQNSKMWPLLVDVASQVEYFGMMLTESEWKDVFTASLRGELKMVPTLDRRRFVMLGLSTSDMGKHEFSCLIELMYAFGSENGVVWSEPAHVEREFAEAQRYLRRAA